jgi:hypothetical protein
MPSLDPIHFPLTVNRQARSARTAFAGSVRPGRTSDVMVSRVAWGPSACSWRHQGRAARRCLASPLFDLDQ